MTNNLSPPASAAMLDEAARVGGEKYARIADRLASQLPDDHPDHGLSPIEIVQSMRAVKIKRGDGSTGPITFGEIAAHLCALTGIELRSESVRRWYRVIDPEISRAPRRAATFDTDGADEVDEPTATPAGIPPAVFQAPPSVGGAP